MIKQEQWESMPAPAQAEAWWQELRVMIRQALEELHYTAGSADTLVLPGLTTVVGKKKRLSNFHP